MTEEPVDGSTNTDCDLTADPSGSDRDATGDSLRADGAVTSDPFGPVYQPAEDSGLLADAAESHARGVVLEVGTGSGWIAERVAGSAHVDRVIGSDLNPHACRAARDRGVSAVRGDLTTPFTADAFDTVVFNPPYLPTVDEADDEASADGDGVTSDETNGNGTGDAISDDAMETNEHSAGVSTGDDRTSGTDAADDTNIDWGERALVGGETGRALIEPFLSDLGRVLRPDGVGLLLVSSLAGFGAVVEHAVACGFRAETIAEESFPFETLSVLRLTHAD